MGRARLRQLGVRNAHDGDSPILHLKSCNARSELHGLSDLGVSQEASCASSAGKVEGPIQLQTIHHSLASSLVLNKARVPSTKHTASPSKTKVDLFEMTILGSRESSDMRSWLLVASRCKASLLPFSFFCSCTTEIAKEGFSTILENHTTVSCRVWVDFEASRTA